MYLKQSLVVLCFALFASCASAQFCVGDYNQTKEINLGEFIVISFNRLNNIHLVWSAKPGPVLLRMFGDREFSIDDYVAVTADTTKQLLMLDSMDFASACLYVIIPTNQYLRAITVEGGSVVDIGPMNITEFGFVVNNGVIKSSSPIYADELELVVKGNGNIAFAPPAGESAVDKIYSSIIGKGNVTYLGEVTNVDVNNGGDGQTNFGLVSSTMNVKLGGTGNTTVVGSPELIVRGSAQPVNYMRVISGECEVKGEDANWLPCITSLDSAYSFAG